MLVRVILSDDCRSWRNKTSRLSLTRLNGVNWQLSHRRTRNLTDVSCVVRPIARPLVKFSEIIRIILYIFLRADAVFLVNWSFLDRGHDNTDVPYCDCGQDIFHVVTTRIRIVNTFSDAGLSIREIPEVSCFATVFVIDLWIVNLPRVHRSLRKCWVWIVSSLEWSAGSLSKDIRRNNFWRTCLWSSCSSF